MAHNSSQAHAISAQYPYHPPHQPTNQTDASQCARSICSLTPGICFTTTLVHVQNLLIRVYLTIWLNTTVQGHRTFCRNSTLRLGVCARARAKCRIDLQGARFP